VSGIATIAAVTTLCAVLAAASHDGWSQGLGGVPSNQPSGAVVLIDSTGKVAARALTDTVVLMSVERDVTAPVSIRPIYGTDGRMASGLAAWQSGGSVLFTSPDCTAGAHVYSGTYAGARAATQVQTPDGIVLYVGSVGISTTVEVRSILYDTGCSSISVRQNGLFPVLATLNLSTTYPPPLSMR
jgi:hypothetical protein